MANLVTVPTFTFYQGDLTSGIDAEHPIRVEYWNGAISLVQSRNGGETEEEVIISPAYLWALFKEIKKHQPEAERKLKS